MLSARRIGEFGSIRRIEGSLSARKLSARHSVIIHHRHFSPKRRWRFATNCVIFIVKLRLLMQKPQLSVEEKVEITTKYYEVMCLNNVTQISEFVASVGLHVGDEEWESLLANIRFVNGRALTLHQILRLMRLLKRKHLRGISSDTQEAFSALAVHGKIPVEVFCKTLDRFDLRIQLPPTRRNSNSNAEDHDSIDLDKFNILLSDNLATEVKTGKLQSLNHTRSAEPTATFGSRTTAAVPSDEAALFRRHADNPKTIEHIFSQIHQSFEERGLFDVSATNSKKKERHQGMESPQRIRHEVFPIKTHHERWTFKEVEQRIDEVERRPDISRAKSSRNVHYCSDDRRPPLALIVPTASPAPQEGSERLAALPSALHFTKRSESVPPPSCSKFTTSTRYPILANRREKLMESLPRRDFTTNGVSSWMLPVEARASLMYSRRYGSSVGRQNAELRGMAAVALQSIASYAGSK